jgi:hypothetical protein
MQIINGLKLHIIPARIFSTATRPLVNAAFDLEQKAVVVSMC